MLCKAIPVPGVTLEKRFMWGLKHINISIWKYFWCTS